MTADWVHLPYDFLSLVSNEIINNVKGINRAVYDISSKPPATIEGNSKKIIIILFLILSANLFANDTILIDNQFYLSI